MVNAEDVEALKNFGDFDNDKMVELLDLTKEEISLYAFSLGSASR